MPDVTDSVLVIKVFFIICHAALNVINIALIAERNRLRYLQFD